MEMEVTSPINVETITRVYSGLPGCGCGCRGKYWSDARNIKRIVKIINSRLDEAKEQDGIFAIEGGSRYFWAYTS